MPPSTLLVTPLVRATPPLERQVAEAIAGGADVVELRVDRIGDAAAVEALLARRPGLPIILTIRPRGEGGDWDADEAARLALLERLGLHLPGFVDFEFSAWQRSANVRQKIGLVCARTDAVDPDGRAKNALVLSTHNLRETPSNLDAYSAALLAAPAEIVKLACLTADAVDAFALMILQGKNRERRLAVMGVGVAGGLTRVLARKFGAALTYAALAADRASAPGQLTLAELKTLYRWNEIRPTTRVYGVVGWPVDESRSPAIHNAALGARRIDGVYVRLPVLPDANRLSRFLDLLEAHPELDVRGLSVTVPHKTHAYQWLVDRGAGLSDAARRCGAVNTLRRDADGSWHGENTDGAGALRLLSRAEDPAARSIQGRSVDVLGAGGAARGVTLALIDAGCRVTLFNRHDDRARDLAAALGCAWSPWSRRTEATGEILINCSSAGMSPNEDESPMPAESIRARLVLDAVYSPLKTRLLSDAAARGIEIRTGAELLLAQAELQHQYWHNDAAPSEAMAAALRAALTVRDS